MLSSLLAGCIKAVNMMERKKVLSNTCRKKRTIRYCVLYFFCSEDGRCVEPRDTNLFTWNWRGGGGVQSLISFCVLVVGEW